MTTYLGVAVAVLCSASAPAVESQILTVGSRVRATAPELGTEPLIGTVVGLEPGAVLVRGGSSATPMRISSAPSTRFEVSGGRKSKAGRGALLGAGIGAMPGLLLTFGDYNSYDPSPGAVAALGAAAGAAVGAAVGGALKSEQWLPAELPAVAAGIAPIRGGLAVSLRLAWGEGHPQIR